MICGLAGIASVTHLKLTVERVRILFERIWTTSAFFRSLLMVLNASFCCLLAGVRKRVRKMLHKFTPCKSLRSYMTPLFMQTYSCCENGAIPVEGGCELSRYVVITRAWQPVTRPRDCRCDTSSHVAAAAVSLLTLQPSSGAFLLWATSWNYKAIRSSYGAD